MEEREGVALLAFGGRDERKVRAEGFGARIGTVPEADFAEDDREPETLFGMVVGGRHTVDIEESEDSVGVALGIDESLAEILGVGIIKRLSAEGGEAAFDAGFLAACGGEGKVTPVSPPRNLTAIVKEVPELLAEIERGRIAVLAGQQANFLDDFLGLAGKMREARLTSSRMDGVVAGISIGDKVAGPIRAKDGEGHVAAS